MKRIDRFVLTTFGHMYVVSFASLVALWIVIDCFTNLDEFQETSEQFLGVLTNIAIYYGYRISWFFQQFYGVITLIAAMMTLTWMRRNNELIALLASGISAYRILAPLLLASVLLNVGGVVNQEVIIPRIADQLYRRPDDPEQTRRMRPYLRADQYGHHLGGHLAYSGRCVIERFELTALTPAPRVPERRIVYLHAPRAYNTTFNGHNGWLLVDANRPEEGDPTWAEQLGPDRVLLERWGTGPEGRRQSIVFIRSELDFTQLTRATTWYQFCSTSDIRRRLEHEPGMLLRREALVTYHMRMTMPLMNMLLVFLGLPFVLSRSETNLFLNLIISIGLCGALFVMQFFSKHLGEVHALSATLAAWSPILLFGVLAFVLWDTIRT